MKIELVWDPRPSVISRYLKEHRYTSGQLWNSIKRYRNEHAAVMMGDDIISLFSINRKWNDVRYHGSSKEGVDLLVKALGKGKWHLFDFPLEHVQQLEGYGKVSIDEPAFMYRYIKDRPPEQTYKGDVGTLRGEHAPVVHDRWGLDEEGGMVGFFRHRIDLGPTSAIFDGERPVAWSGTYHKTPWVVQLGYLFVEPEYRRMGYGRAISADLIAKVMSKGKVPLIHVFKGNTASEELVERLGFKALSERFWGSFTFD